jgi:hypothetical protein
MSYSCLELASARLAIREHGDMTPDHPAAQHTTDPAEQDPSPRPAKPGTTRADLEHPQALLLAEQRARRELAEIAEQCPDHLLGTECYPGRARRYLARAKPGTTANPWLVMTADIGELRAALIPPPGPPQRHARSVE